MSNWMCSAKAKARARAQAKLIQAVWLNRATIKQLRRCLNVCTMRNYMCKTWWFFVFSLCSNGWMELNGMAAAADAVFINTITSFYFTFDFGNGNFVFSFYFISNLNCKLNLAFAIRWFLRVNTVPFLIWIVFWRSPNAISSPKVNSKWNWI